MSDQTFATTYGDDVMVITKDVGLVLGTAQLGDTFGTIKAATIIRTGEREVVVNNIGEVLMILMKTPGFNLTLKCAFDLSVIAPGMGERLILPFVGLRGYVMDGVIAEWESGGERGLSISVSSWDSLGDDAVVKRYAPGEDAVTLGAVRVPAPTERPVLTGEAGFYSNTLIWTPARRADRYEVRALNPNDGVDQIVATITGFTWTDEDRLPYDVRGYDVRGVNDTGAGPWSDMVELTTLIQLITQAPVLSDVDEGRLSYTPGVTWPAVPHAEIYVVQLSTDEGVTWSVESEQAETTWRNDDLARGMSHRVRVTATNSRSSSSVSESVTQTAGELGTPTVGGTSGAGFIDLSWAEVPAVSELETTYVIEKSDDLGVTWSALATTTDLSYLHTYVADGEVWTYRVQASNVIEYGPWSDTITLEGGGLPVLTLTTAMTPGKIVLTWPHYATIVGVTSSYELEVSIGNAGAWTSLYTGTVASYEHSYITGGSVRRYRARMTNTEETGEWSAVVSLTHPGLTRPVLAASAQPTGVALTWGAIAAAAGVASTYEIRWSTTDGVTWSSLTTTTDAFYTHAHVGSGTDVDYQVRVFNVNENGPWSESAVVSPQGLRKPILTAVAAPGQVTLTWPDYPQILGLDNVYTLQVSADGGATWTQLYSGAAIEFVHGYITGGSVRRYRVRISNSAADGLWSDVVVVTHPGLAAPVLTATPAPGVVLLTWSLVQDAFDVEHVHELQVSADGGATWTQIMSGGIREYTHGYIRAVDNRRYRVRIVNANEAGPWSIVRAVAGFGLAAPSITTHGWLNATTVQLTYSTRSIGGGVTSYARVQVSTDDGATWTLLTEGVGTNQSITDDGYTAGEMRLYRVMAYNELESSAWSATREVTRVALAAPSLSLAPHDSDQIRASWSPLSGATGYELEWGFGGDVTGTASTAYPGEIDVTPTLIQATTPPIYRTNDLYTFRARALFGGVWGDWSAPAVISGAIIPLAPDLSWDGATYTLTITLDDGGDPGVQVFQINIPAGGYVGRTGTVTVVDLSQYSNEIDNGMSGYTEAKVSAIRQAGWLLGDEATINLS